MKLVKHKTTKKKKKSAMIAIASALILIATYGIKDFLKERAKDAADSLQSAESLHRTEQGQSLLWVQTIALITSTLEAKKANGGRPAGERFLT